MPDEWDDAGDEEDEEFGPGDPDYDLSEAHGYSVDAPRQRPIIAPRLMLVVSIVLVVALVAPALVILIERR